MPPDLCWPFEPVCLADGTASAWVALHGPLVSPPQHDCFAQLRRCGARLVGVSSYFDFPRRDSRDGLDYEAVCEAWCHCFRQPDDYLAAATPRALLSASDFTDWTWVARQAARAAPPGLHDVVYVGAAEDWQAPAKNGALAARCLPRLHLELGLRSLVVGRAELALCGQAGITQVDRLDWPPLLAAMAAARLVFCPNALDPSPRVIAEALCLDRPVLVHRAILGGWKYVNRHTGDFFDDEQDVVEAASRLLGQVTAPRDWFRAHHGPAQAGRRLAGLLRPLDATLAAEAGLWISPAGPRPHPAA